MTSSPPSSLHDQPTRLPWIFYAAVLLADAIPPKLATLMDDSEADVLAYMTFRAQHRTKLHSMNPFERLNGEIKRRTEVVDIFPPLATPPSFARRSPGRALPNEAAITRLVGAILLEQNDERAVPRPSAVHPTVLRTA